MKLPRGACPIRASLTALVLAMPASSEPVPGASLQGVTYTITEGGSSTIRAYDEQLGLKWDLLTDVQFRPLDLAGYAVKDRLRRDLPGLDAQTGPAPCIRLPGAGSIYRIARDGSESLILVRGDDPLHVLLTVSGTDALLGTLHVSPDGSWILAASSAAAGGDVHAISTHAAAPPLLLTGGLAPLDDLAPQSLRTNGSVAWFVAGGELYRAAVAPGANAVRVDLPGSEPVAPELVLAAEAGAVVALQEQGNGERRLFLARVDGSPTSVSHDDHFHAYSLPNYDAPLGPHVAVSPDGRFVAFRREEGSQHELELYDALTPSLVDLTTPPDYPAYIDSIGVLAFGQPRVLCFFAGDTHANPHDPSQTMGAADMYAVELSGSEPVFLNITRTSGQASPPFTQNAALALDRVLVGPNAERFFTLGPVPGGTQLGCFRIDGAGDPHDPNLQVLTGPVAFDPTIVGSPLGIVFDTIPIEPIPPFAQPSSDVTCSGDPAYAPLVRIIASDDADPFADDARVWFDGTVDLGSTFVADALAAGEAKLQNETFLHVLDAAGTPLQTVEFKTSCSEPLVLGDRFGSLQLVDAVGENQPLDGPVDYCVYGPKPRMLRMTYTGDGCEATNHAQDPSKVECSGDTGGEPLVRIRASDKEDANDSSARVWFDGVVALGETFHVDAFQAGETELKSDTFLHVYSDTGVLLQYVKFHTSCSQPLRPNDQFGSARLINCVLEAPLDPTDACAAGRPRSLTFTYLGEGCGPRDFGPQLRSLGPLDGPPPYGVSLARAGWSLPYSLPVGAEIDTITPSRDDRHVAFVARPGQGPEQAFLVDIVAGTVSRAPCAPAARSRLGFSHAGALCVAREEGGFAELLLLPRYGRAVTIEATPGVAHILSN